MLGNIIIFFEQTAVKICMVLNSIQKLLNLYVICVHYTFPVIYISNFTELLKHNL